MRFSFEVVVIAYEFKQLDIDNGAFDENPVEIFLLGNITKRIVDEHHHRNTYTRTTFGRGT